MTSSVLIPSFRRPAALLRCLEALSAQSVLPGEVLVVWQGDDSPTRDAVASLRPALAFELKILHLSAPGIVPAENLALDHSRGDVIVLIDDDAVPPRQWLERHLRCFNDATVGAVGGPALNFRPDGTRFDTRTAGPTAKLTWYGQAIGNTYDHPEDWRARDIIEADHLVGNNMSLRRTAFERFEAGLLPYWQMFETDACLQVTARGYRVLFDFGNPVEHHPTNVVFAGGRGGDLCMKVYHAAYNHAFVLAKHTARGLRAIRLLFLLGAGSVSAPGLIALPLCIARFGQPARELSILWNTWRYRVAGWRAGARAM